MRTPTQANPIDQKVVDAMDLRTRALKERAKGDSDNLQAINYYFNSRTPWIRMISSVDTAKHGSKLAADNILGTLKDDSQQYLPSGTELSSLFGVRPKAGITSMQVTSLGRFGALRDITVSFTCFSKEQLDIYEQLYMRPGLSVLIEWGHSLYLKEEGNSIKVKQMGPGYSGMFDNTAKSILGVYEQIKAKRKVYNYEYDGAFGLIKNFSWSFDGKNQSYSCQVVIGSCGEVIGSIPSTKPLPSDLVQLYTTSNTYGTAPVPEPTQNPPSGSYVPPNPASGSYVPPSTAAPQSSTATALPAYAQQTGAWYQQRFQEIDEKFVPFLDARTEHEVSSMLRTFLYQDLICGYHLEKIREAQIKVAIEGDLDVNDISDEPLDKSVPKYDNFILLSDITPNNPDLAIDRTTWLIDVLGYTGQLLTIFFMEEEEESAEDLTQEELKALNSLDELETYTRYRAMSYLRYGDLLSFINQMMLFDSTKPLLEFDTAPIGSMYYNELLHSLDPRICLLPPDVATFAADQGITFTKGTDYDKILDIALNISMLYEVSENTVGSVKDFLDGVNFQIAKATGNIIDLDVTYSEETAKYIVVDRRRYRAEILPTISMLGTDTMATDFKLSTSISNNLVNSVAISVGPDRGSSARNDVSKTLLNFHQGITDRNLPVREEYPPSILKSNTTISGDLTDQNNRALIEITLEALYAGRLFSDELTDNLVNLYPKYIIENAQSSSLGGVIIPYTLSTTLDGISGLLVMDSFQLKTDIIPSSYVTGNKVANLILGVDSQVDKSGWRTTIKSQYYNVSGLPKDVRIGNYKYNSTPPLVGTGFTSSTYASLYHNGQLIYTLDPNSPRSNLAALEAWTSVNFNQTIQPQIIGLIDTMLKNLIPLDIAQIPVQDLYSLSIVVTSTFRTLEKQKYLYDEAKAGRNNGIPAAEPGNSMHNWGGAFDFNLLNSKTGDILFSGNTPESDWKQLGIDTIVSPFGFRYGIQNDPIHTAYNVSGKTIMDAYNTGKVVNFLGNSITDTSGSVIDPTLYYISPELHVDLTKFTTTPGSAQSQYAPMQIKSAYQQALQNNTTLPFDFPQAP